MMEDYTGDVLRVVIKSEEIALAALSFLCMAKTGEIFFTSKDSRVHQKDVPPPDRHRGPMELLTPVSPGLYEVLHNLGLFEIFRG